MSVSLLRLAGLMFPFLCSLVAFGLVITALTAGAGSLQQQLEEYHILAVSYPLISQSGFEHDIKYSGTNVVQLNASSFGHAFSLNTPKDETDQDDSYLDNVLDNLSDDLSGSLSGIFNEPVDTVTRLFNISRWYSLHLNSYCKGNFSPSSALNVTSCIRRVRSNTFNLTDIFFCDIKTIPNGLDIDSLLPSGTQQVVNYLSDFFLAALLAYAVGYGLTGVSVLLCVILPVCLQRAQYSKPIMVQVLVAILAFLILVIGSGITVFISNKSVSRINHFGEGIGISASSGTKFIAVSWAASALMFILCLYWTILYVVLKAHDPRPDDSHAADPATKVPRPTDLDRLRDNPIVGFGQAHSIYPDDSHAANPATKVFRPANSNGLRDNPTVSFSHTQ
ncbi:Uu.00g120000.m01.CDS01 [Anthostomella pinea]|uniref:Uu.00g120000.m01.CDS01 n=1 Tax=Anthostomella pinea TaxID=933095 RepID=A0AAI8YH70_9PEZI|nr:Uu.00g120000.m01.CDS01 [Anthostomella pinea]